MRARVGLLVLTTADFRLRDNGVEQRIESVMLEEVPITHLEDTGGALHEATSDGLRDTFVRVVNEFRSRYVLTYVPDGVSPRGWHSIEVAVTSRRAQVTARQGYLR